MTSFWQFESAIAVIDLPRILTEKNEILRKKKLQPAQYTIPGGITLGILCLYLLSTFGLRIGQHQMPQASTAAGDQWVEEDAPTIVRTLLEETTCTDYYVLFSISKSTIGAMIPADKCECCCCRMYLCLICDGDNMFPDTAYEYISMTQDQDEFTLLATPTYSLTSDSADGFVFESL